MARRNGSDPDTPKTAGELVEQPHGGRLWRGSPANPVPGPGRTPSILRDRLRASLAARIPFLERVADGKVKGATLADRMKAVELLMRYGLGTTVTETDTEGRDVIVRVVRAPMAAVPHDN